MSISEKEAPARSRLYFANSRGALCPQIPVGAQPFAPRLLGHIGTDSGDYFTQVPLSVGPGSFFRQMLRSSGRLGQTGKIEPVEAFHKEIPQAGAPDVDET
jgi:hypothetical protein